MNKLFLQACVILCFLLSCQSEDIVSAKIQSNGKKSNALSEAEISSLSKSNISDPTFIEPDNPEGEGGAGGDLTFVLPAAPIIDNGSPYVLAGRTGALFSPFGTNDAELVGFSKSGPKDPRPLLIVPSALGLTLGFTFISSGVRYVVQGYTVAVYNGQIQYWTEPKSVRIVLTSASYGQSMKFVGTTYDQQGNIVELAHWECTSCSSAGTVQGELKITNLVLNAQGLTLEGVVTIPGKTFQISKVNWKRLW